MILGILQASLDLLHEMSPYLIFGFFFAGLLHIFVPLEKIATHLGQSTFASVLKAVLFGIPLPLCSCSVIPAGVLLREKGASKGAVISFFIATPITSIDSIFATYSLLGSVFTIYRLIASAITSLIAGVLTNLLIGKGDKSDATIDNAEASAKSCCDHEHAEGEAKESAAPTKRRLLNLLDYAFVKLLGDVWKPLVLGLLLGGLITYLMPDSFIDRHLGDGWIAMLLMLIFGIPMYVCSTGSIPIAAALMAKGMSPGAALVFLLAGPATNAVTIAVVTKELGKAAAALYVTTIAICSILLGLLLNLVADEFDATRLISEGPMEMLPPIVGYGSSILLVALIVNLFWRKFRKG